MDKIIIRDLEIFANHGVFQEETVLGQKFVLNVTIDANLEEASKNDNLEKSIHYGMICEKIAEIMKEPVKLIETAARRVCDGLLTEFNRIINVEVEIQKPWAPIGMHLNYAGVCMKRSRHRVFLSLGSNMGNCEEYLKNAIQKIENDKCCRVIKESSFIITKPVGDVVQPDFLNACIEIETFDSPEELLGLLHQIEQEANRVRTVHWGPRTLDIDIILYDEISLHTRDLIIPHKEMHKRIFVLEPLMEIAPWAYHPLLRKTVEELYIDLQK